MNPRSCVAVEKIRKNAHTHHPFEHPNGSAPPLGSISNAMSAADPPIRFGPLANLSVMHKPRAVENNELQAPQPSPASRARRHPCTLRLSSTAAHLRLFSAHLLFGARTSPSGRPSHASTDSSLHTLRLVGSLAGGGARRAPHGDQCPQQ